MPKIVKPTPKERTEILRRLRKKYPQMFEKVNVAGNKRLMKNVSKSDREALQKMVAPKMKKEYR